MSFWRGSLFGVTRKRPSIRTGSSRSKLLSVKSLISPTVSAMTLFLITWSLSCASLRTPLLPRLENRVLEISLDSPSLFYAYKVCVKTVLGICLKEEIHKDVYDLTDPAIRKQLKDMGFWALVTRK